MRLLQLSGQDGLRLSSFHEDKLPPYAILSHTWGANTDEVSFHDVTSGEGKAKNGYGKIMFCGQQAKQDDLLHFWVDTCCIKKDDSTELGAAINSMFRWYQKAAKCYVYLADVSTSKRSSEAESPNDWHTAFRKSRWFKRTLQELLAPKVVEFWSCDGKLLGSKESLKSMISEVTGIPPGALSGTPLSQFTMYERLRWAAGRDTTMKEDKAYCLFGIFDLFLPMIYGEGDYAFTRLTNEIEKLNKSALPTRTSTVVSLHEPSSSDCRRRELLESLSFEQIDARHSSIKPAQSTSCKWLLKHPYFMSWYGTNACESRDGPAILWIEGKAGAGKSTLMKFAHTYATAAKQKRDNEVVLSFFLKARGDQPEKTTIGMYRSLLLRLLTAAPDLQTVLDEADVSTLANSGSVSWTSDQLQKLLAAAIERLGRRRLTIFIDALDECNEQQIRDMMEFFEDDVLRHDHQVSVCFASRPYPSIYVRDAHRLVLDEEAGHADDLKEYVQRRFQAGRGKLADKVRQEILEKANGVFLWVVLVVDILNKVFDSGRIFDVEKRLRDIHGKLSDLFEDLIRRDRANMDEFLLCLQWILFAKRPLKCEEFYFAMEAGGHLHSDESSTWTPNPWDPETVSIEDMKRFVLNASKGLAELTRAKKAATVQFIHESVTDFLVKEGGLYELWPELGRKLAPMSHDKLKQCCRNYLRADLAGFLDYPQALPRAVSTPAKKSRENIQKHFPFHEYKCWVVLHHANKAAEAIDQTSFMASFDLSLEDWIKSTNVYQRHEIRRHSLTTDLLYILAEYGHDRLITFILRSDM